MIQYKNSGQNYTIMSEITMKNNIFALRISLLHTRTQSIHSTCSNLQNVLVVHVQYVIFTDDCSQNEHECFVRFS